MGLHRYTFWEDGEVHILIDAGAMLYKDSIPQILLASGIEILSDMEVVGYGKAKGGWNVGEEYTVYFYACFDVPMFGCGTIRNMQIKPDLKKEYPLNIHDYSRNGCYFSYKVRAGEQLNICVEISFISAEKAKENAEKEMAKDDFETIRKKAHPIWETCLRKVSVGGMTDDERMIFYSALYRTIIQPSNRIGENPKWNSSIPYYDDLGFLVMMILELCLRGMSFILWGYFPTRDKIFF